jgi:hypothetical protein
VTEKERTVSAVAAVAEMHSPSAKRRRLASETGHVESELHSKKTEPLEVQAFIDSMQENFGIDNVTAFFSQNLFFFAT